MADDNAGDGGTKTFTQADVDAIVRERLKRERDKFADYEDLKKQAGDADKNRTALEKLLDRFGDLEKRLADSAMRDLRAEAAEKKGLTRAQAARLVGNTLEELLSDADEMIASWRPKSDGKGDTGSDGAKGDAGKADGQGDGKDGGTGKAGDAGKSSDDAKGDAGKDGAKGDGDGKDGKAGKPYPPSGRPTEKLSSGAVPGATGDKTPAQLAEEILSRPF